jgi:hypothetical protein
MTNNINTQLAWAQMMLWNDNESVARDIVSKLITDLEKEQ